MVGVTNNPLINALVKDTSQNVDNGLGLDTNLTEIISAFSPYGQGKTEVQANATLENLRKNAVGAIKSGDYSEITATNPVMGNLLKTLGESSLSKDDQIKLLNLVVEVAKDLSDPSSPEAINRTNDKGITSGILNPMMNEGQALKLAAGIAAGIIAESAKNAQEEQARMRQLESQIGAIPSSVKATVIAEFDIKNMTSDQLIALVNREMVAQNKNKFGDSTPVTPHENTVTA